jgi:TonB family protein
MLPSKRYQTYRFFKTGGVSLLLHIAVILLLSLNPWPKVMKIRPSVYSVTLMPIPLPAPQVPKPAPLPPVKEEPPKPAEKPPPKPILEKPKKEDIVEKIKKPEQEKSSKRIQEALEEIRKKVALDEIQKRVARREQKEEPPVPPAPAPQGVAPARPPESKWNEYYSRIWAKIKESWTIPENLLKETVDLETVIVVIIERDGRVQKWWFEKKSGDEVYDQMALRAIKKAEPLPPIPKELNEKTLEVGIRFYPD